MDSILGRTILGYKVIEKIGTGGFGDVYKVERTNIVGKVTRALKVITLPKENQYLEVLNSMGGDYRKADEYFKKELDRVVNEIRVFAMISEKDNHYIVSYYENDVEKSGKYKYNIYILMEIMTPLDKWLHENNLTVSEAIDISLEVAKGLKVCHQNNIMHRDIKLNNIFVSKDGKFKLGDFGVSKRLDTLTRSHTIKGTPHYIAPEIYVKNEKYNKQADIYSLGILMYYLFNKRRYPFYPNYPKVYQKEDEDRAFYKRMQYEKMEAPICAPGNVTDIILKALEAPEKRYRDVQEVIEALEAAKEELNEEKLSVKIGFEPENTGKTKGDSDREEKVIRALEKNTVKSISFNEHSIDTKWEHRRGNNTLKKVSVVGLILLCAVIALAVALKKNNGQVAVEQKNNISTVNGENPTENITETEVQTTENIQVIRIKDYRGQDYRQAVKTMKKKGLLVKQQKIYSQNVKKGAIISQNIAPGTEVVEGTTIAIKVSKGTKAVETTAYVPATKAPTVNNNNSKKQGFDFGDIVE